MLRVGASTVKCGSVKLVALRIWASAVECGSAKPWVWCWYHPKAGKITLRRRRMLLAVLEKETKAWVSPTHARPLHLHHIQFFFSYGSTVAAWKIGRWKEGGSKRREERKKKKIDRKVKWYRCRQKKKKWRSVTSYCYFRRRRRKAMEFPIKKKGGCKIILCFQSCRPPLNGCCFFFWKKYKMAPQSFN